MSNLCPECDVLIISEFQDICIEAKRKNLYITVDEYQPAFEVRAEDDKYQLIGKCTSLLELATIVYDHPYPGFGDAAK